MKDIFQQGDVFVDDTLKTIYLTPDEPLVYDVNKWDYKQMPSIKSWEQDMKNQLDMHKKQASHHLAFTFPENTLLDQQWLDKIQTYDFELGLMELYAIESQNIKKHKNDQIKVMFVTEQTLEDYITIYRQFAEPFGEAYADESIEVIRNQFNKDSKSRVIAYKADVPVGILDLIISQCTVEIDGFGVDESYQKQGIGSTMQTFVAEVADTKPIILIADGEDSAKEMYIRQGYIYISYCYQILKENAKHI